MNKTGEPNAKQLLFQVQRRWGNEEAARGFGRHLVLERSELDLRELPLQRGVGHDDPDESGHLRRPRADSTRARSGCKRESRSEWSRGLDVMEPLTLKRGTEEMARPAEAGAVRRGGVDVLKRL